MHVPKRFLIGTLVAVLGLAVPGHVASAATKTAFTVGLQLIEIGEPARSWVADGIQHVRDEPYVATVSGDLEGTFVVLRDSGTDMATGVPVYVTGTFELMTSSETWTGRATATWTRVKIVGKGSDGSILRAVFTPTGEDTAVLDGTILAP